MSLKCVMSGVANEGSPPSLCGPSIAQPATERFIALIVDANQIIGTGVQIGDFVCTLCSKFLIVFCGTSIAAHESGEIWEGILANKSGHVILSNYPKLQYNLVIICEITRKYN